MNKKFKLKEKPKVPVREKVRKYLSIYDGETLQNIVSAIPANIDFNDVKLEEVTHSDYYSDYKEYRFTYDVMQSEDEFNEELENYNKKLEKYKKWVEQNEDNIKQYHQKEEENAKQKRAKKLVRMAREITEAEKEVIILRKNYEKETKKVNN